MADLMKVGSDFGGSGTFKPFTASISGAQRVTDAHGRYMDAALQGRLFGGGLSALTPINNVTFTTGTLGVTCTPIIGLWNPKGSRVNAVVLQAALTMAMTALQATGAGPFVWCGSLDNGGLTLGAAPLDRGFMMKSGSKIKDLSGLALTGLTNNLVPLFGSALGGGSALALAFLATAVAMQTQLPTGVPEAFDGSLVVPPGGVLALLATTTPVAHSAVSAALWEETPAGLIIV